MAKGFLAGAGLGLVAAVGAAAALSVVVGFPEGQVEEDRGSVAETSLADGSGAEDSQNADTATGGAADADGAGSRIEAEPAPDRAAGAPDSAELSASGAGAADDAADDADGADMRASDAAENAATGTEAPAETEEPAESSMAAALDATPGETSAETATDRTAAAEPGAADEISDASDTTEADVARAGDADAGPPAVAGDAPAETAPVGPSAAGQIPDIAAQPAPESRAQDAPDAVADTAETATGDALDAPDAAIPAPDGAAISSTAAAESAEGAAATVDAGSAAASPASDPADATGATDAPSPGPAPEASRALAALPEAQSEPVPGAETANGPVVTAEPDPAPADDPAEAPAASAPPEDETPDTGDGAAETADGDEAEADADRPRLGDSGTTGRVGTPARSLVGRDDPARSTRLPRVGEAPATEPAAASSAETRPVEDFAVAAEVAEDLPRMAIVLIDDGAGPLGPEALESFPFPLTFAVDPGLPDARARMTGYRARGFEVMALADLPVGARPSDVEVALEAALSALPEAVGVLEAPGLTLQSSREVSTQATDYLAASGHGLVMQPNGLNTAQSLAARDGVPSASIFRDFDGEGQDPRVQRRFLDQAAFRARQEDGVVMLGRLRADTISALLLWGLQDRASQVALVPVTAVLGASSAP